MLSGVRPFLLVLLLLPVELQQIEAKLGTDPKAVPVYEEPFHHVVFENKMVRVLDVHIPAGKATRFHIHPNPLTGVTIHDEPGWEEIQGRDRGPKARPDKAGEVFDNWTRKRPYTHRVGNIGHAEIHYVATEWLAPSGVVSEPLPDTATRKLIKQGEWVSVYHIKLAPGESTEMHKHAAPGITIQSFDAAAVIKGDKPASSGGTGAGAWQWRNAGHQHQFRNSGTQPVEIVEIDWK